MPYCGRPGGPPSPKLSLLANACVVIGLSKSKKRDQGTPYRRCRLCTVAGEENFLFVNESPRRLLLHRAGNRGAWRIAVVCANDMRESEGDRS
jgi:hypothetical protein